jgi:hypothetical protein
MFQIETQPASAIFLSIFPTFEAFRAVGCMQYGISQGGKGIRENLTF